MRPYSEYAYIYIFIMCYMLCVQWILSFFDIGKMNGSACSCNQMFSSYSVRVYDEELSWFNKKKNCMARELFAVMMMMMVITFLYVILVACCSWCLIWHLASYDMNFVEEHMLTGMKIQEWKNIYIIYKSKLSFMYSLYNAIGFWTNVLTFLWLLLC